MQNREANYNFFAILEILKLITRLIMYYRKYINYEVN